MDQVHIHLLITHLPVFGSLLGALVLAHGILSKSRQACIAAYYVLIISSLGAGIAYLTGEGAEHAVKGITGVTRGHIHTHEHFALYALVSLTAMGLVSIVALIMTRKKSTYRKSLAILVLLLSLISFVLVARTAYLGGQVRHTELSSQADESAQDPLPPTS